MFRKIRSWSGSKISRFDFLSMMGQTAAAVALARIPLVSDTAAQSRTPLIDSNRQNNDLFPDNSAVVFQRGGEIIAKSYLGANIGSGVAGTDDSLVIQSAIDALSNMGGGVLYVQTGTYHVASIIPKSNVHMRFNNSAVFKRSGAATSAIFRHRNQPTGMRNFILEGGTFTGGNAWYSEGNISYCGLVNNRFYGDDGINEFLVFFDAYGANPYNTITGNLFSGPTGGKDMLGSGHLDHCEISFNRFENGDGQGWGAADIHFTRCIGNEFYNVGNSIGMEGTCEGNIVSGNSSYLSRNLKLSGTGGNIKHISRWNIVEGNCIAYSGGIEDLQGYQDLIKENIIIRSKNGGIFGSFDRCDISNNILFETNSDHDTIIVGGLPHNDGGIVLLDNKADMPHPTGNKILGNTLYTSKTDWIFPAGGTKQGYTGGILIDSTYDSCIVESNIIDNVYGDAIAYYGNSRIIRNNVGFSTGTFKASLVITVGKANEYARAASVSSPSGIITFFNEKITIKGISLQKEMITVKTEVVHDRYTTVVLEKPFKTAGSFYLTNDELLSLWRNQSMITTIHIYAKSNAPVTEASVTVDIFGSG
jgi:hypothetical protein